MMDWIKVKMMDFMLKMMEFVVNMTDCRCRSYLCVWIRSKYTDIPIHVWLPLVSFINISVYLI